MYVCMYVHICVYMYVCMYTRFGCIFVRQMFDLELWYVMSSICVYMHVCVYMCIYVCMYVCILGLDTYLCVRCLI